MQPRPAEKLEQQDHLMFLIGRAAAATPASLLELGHTRGELRARAFAAASRFQNTRPDEFGDVLEFVAGKAIQKATGLGLRGSIGTRGEGGD
jgi:hypothetical protein